MLLRWVLDENEREREILDEDEAEWMDSWSPVLITAVVEEDVEGEIGWG